MSHVSKVKTTIKRVNGQLLEEAVAAVARTLPGCTVERDAIPKEYAGRTDEGDRCPVVLKWNEFNRGLGVRVNGQGELEFVADSYQHNTTVRDAEQRIEQFYTGAATRKAMQMAGFHVQATTNANGELVLEGVR